MKKEKEFLNQLNIELEKNGFKNKQRKAIVLKYKKTIDERLSNKEKIYKILRDIGTPLSIVETEKNNKEDISLKLKKFYKKITKDITLNDIFKIKDKNTQIHENRNTKTNFFKILIDNISKNIKKLKNNFTKKEKNIIKKEEVNVNEEITIEKSDNTENVKPKLILTDKQRRRKKIIDILNTIIIIILILLWQWSLVMTFACLFAYLDGVKLFGILLLIFGISLLMLWFVIVTINSIYKKFNLFKFKIISLLTIIFIISLGIGTSIYQIYKLDIVSDVSSKYKMTTKSNKYNMPKGDNAKMYILFNGNYDTQYIINYDNDLDGSFKVEVNYYEEYYDFYEKNSSNNIYISLRKDNRDIISTYINGLKDKEIYSSDELLRYVVRITISEKDYERLVVEN